MSLIQLNHGIQTITIVLLSLFQLILSNSEFVEANTTLSVEPPLLYLGPYTKQCNLDSPEYFYREVAAPAISALNEEAKGFFGILMDKLESAVTELEKGEKEKLEKQWIYIMDTVRDSLDRTIHRIQSTWGVLVAISDTSELPWESSVKVPLEGEFLNEMEYEYAMIEAIVKAGVKEIVGTLQNQLVKVIQTLEKHVEKLTKEKEKITEMKLLSKMEKSLNKMEPTFIGNLLKKIVARGIAARSGSAKKPSNRNKTFLTEIMQDTAIVFQAYRQKGQHFPKFWTQITEIMGQTSQGDISSFIDLYSGNEDLFIENVMLILTLNKLAN